MLHYIDFHQLQIENKQVRRPVVAAAAAAAAAAWVQDPHRAHARACGAAQDVAKIDERNQELLKLKMTTGRTVQVLNNLKVPPRARTHARTHACSRERLAQSLGVWACCYGVSSFSKSLLLARR